MDPRLVDSAANGDQAAFERLMVEMYARLHRIAHGILRDDHLAEDAVQSAVLSIWQELQHLRDPARFEAWAYRIVVNACRRESRSARSLISGVEQRLLDRASHDRGPGTVLDRDQLDRAFRRLSVEHRAVVVLRFFVDMPMARVAETLQIPLGTANSRLHHAMRTLRASIEADERLPSAHDRRPEVER